MKTSASPWIPVVCCALLSACATPTLPTSQGHIREAAPAAGAIPDTVQQSTALRPPSAASKPETYSVTVHKVPVQSLLFALARDAGMNVDIYPGLEGTVTLNAIDQTLPQLLTRIARQVDMRYEIDGKNLSVLPDAPVWRNYKIDYVNMARSTTSSVNIATQISTAGNSSNNSNTNGSSGGSAGNVLTAASNSSLSNNNSNSNANNTASANNGGNSGPPNNNSTTSVTNRSDNNFWASLERNIRDMLRETSQGAAMPGMAMQAQPALMPGALPSQVMPAAGDVTERVVAPREPTAVVVNVEAGLIAVRASGRQHEKVQAFLDLVMNSAKRQVLIEATILEVRLSDQYQQGINWSRLGGALKLSQGSVGTTVLPSAVVPGTSAGMFVANYLKGNLSTTIQLLESFGKVKVLSSPKISVLNNQTALLKVVDNNVFFTITVTPAVVSSTGTVTTPATYESKLETVPVGFVMSVTPQISDNDMVTLNVRPTITRIVGYVRDPNPALNAGNVVSQVPVIQARELESIMKVSSGQTAVMGGLMQDSVDNTKDGVPGLSSLPLIGNLFSYRNEASAKTELVIFMRPLVIKDASVNGDYKDYRYLLPGDEAINSEPYSETRRGATPSASAPRASGDGGL